MTTEEEEEKEQRKGRLRRRGQENHSFMIYGFNLRQRRALHSFISRGKAVPLETWATVP